MEAFANTIPSSLPKGKARDYFAETLNTMVTQGNVAAAKELTADTRAVLHEFRNMTKTFEYLEELEAEIGVFNLDKLSDPVTGCIDKNQYVKLFLEEQAKRVQNYGRIKLPFTQDASEKLAICARHSRPLVAQALTVHSQEVYDFAFDLHQQVQDLKRVLLVRIEIIKSTLDLTYFRSYATGHHATLESYKPASFPVYLPNISLMDPDMLLVGDSDSYAKILTAFANYVSIIEGFLEPWGDLLSMLEMWQRTCVKANRNVKTRAAVPQQAITSARPKLSRSATTAPASQATDTDLEGNPQSPGRRSTVTVASTAAASSATSRASSDARTTLDPVTGLAIKVDAPNTAASSAATSPSPAPSSSTQSKPAKTQGNPFDDEFSSHHTSEFGPVPEEEPPTPVDTFVPDDLEEDAEEPVAAFGDQTMLSASAELDDLQFL
eukprot:TRINITY_DN7559_c0_g1_i1.p1 TRINITY_DN7559_c0_g1~~TRINITY_DN7559_c0_g1_i1.p1  ORF type:complete len:504 (+),score=109.00 TRINITY_DN7559_c0_g1_i1:206-1513(+)